MARQSLSKRCFLILTPTFWLFLSIEPKGSCKSKIHGLFKGSNMLVEKVRLQTLVRKVLRRASFPELLHDFI